MTPFDILNTLALEAAKYSDLTTIADARAAKRRAGAAEMVALRAQGWKVAAIAARFGVSNTAMSQRLLRAGQRAAV